MEWAILTLHSEMTYRSNVIMKSSVAPYRHAPVLPKRGGGVYPSSPSVMNNLREKNEPLFAIRGGDSQVKEKSQSLPNNSFYLDLAAGGFEPLLSVELSRECLLARRKQLGSTRPECVRLC